MPETSLVVKAEDRYSEALRKMSTVTRAFSKTAEEMEKTLEALSRQAAPLSAGLREASTELNAARKQFNETRDEASRLRLEMAQANYDGIKRNLNAVTRTAREAEKQFVKLGKAEKESSGAGGFGSSIVKAVAQTGITELGRQLIMEGTRTLASSALGDVGGTLVSGVLSNAGAAASAGFMMGGPTGAAIGALVGGGAGLISGGIQVFQKQDDSFKAYVQSQVEGQLAAMESAKESGSAIAGRREQDQLAFAQRFGSDEAAADYLAKVKAMVVKTNYTYDEITGYSKRLLNTYDPEKTLSVLTDLSDATAGLNLDQQGVSMFINGLSRMRTTGKATQEYLNYFSERGLDVYQALADSTGADKSQIAGMVTKGDITGGEAADAILTYIQEQFGGLSDKLSNTYDAMVDNLGDAQANLDAKMGEGYNEARKDALTEQQSWLESGRMDEAYSAIGAWKAELENAKEEYVRDAVDTAIGGAEYEKARREGDAAEMGRIIMQARIDGMNEYSRNEGKEEQLAQELALIEGVRDDASEGYYDAGYALGQEFSKGRADGIAETVAEVFTPSTIGGVTGRSLTPEKPETTGIRNKGVTGRSLQPKRTGMERVPYDNYPALLHEGERVLTASEARGQDRKNGLEVGGVVISGNEFHVRQDSDIDAIAQALLERIQDARAAGG